MRSIGTAFNSRNVPSLTTLDQIEAGAHPAVCAPFYGKSVIIIARRLTAAQIRSCGEFSLIETVQDLINKKVIKNKTNFTQMNEYAELQHNIIKLSMVNPTYDEILGVITKGIDPIEDQLKNIRGQLWAATDGEEKQKLAEEFNMLELQAKYILPADFIGFMFSYAVGVDQSDIELVTEDMLYEAAIMALNGHDNPSDHLSGNFSDFNKEDINKRAWILYHQRKKKEA